MFYLRSRLASEAMLHVLSKPRSFMPKSSNPQLLFSAEPILDSIQAETRPQTSARASTVRTKPIRIARTRFSLKLRFALA